MSHSARLLQARKPNAPAEWMQKLPQMARRLEESLFRSAHSFVFLMVIKNHYQPSCLGRLQRHTNLEKETSSAGDSHGAACTTAKAESGSGWR